MDNDLLAESDCCTPLHAALTFLAVFVVLPDLPNSWMILVLKQHMQTSY